MTVKVFSSIQHLKSSLELNSEDLFHEANETILFGFPKQRVPPREVNPNFRNFFPGNSLATLLRHFMELYNIVPTFAALKIVFANRFDRVTSSLVKFGLYQVNVIIGKAVVT